MTTTVRPRTPAEIAVIIPYQLGFHPGPSVILTVLRGRRLGLLQRHDLRTDPSDCAQVADQALEIVTREEATGLLVIAFEDDEGSSAPLCTAMLAAADDHEVPVQEHVVVRGGRWFGPECSEACCPDEGLPLPRPEDVPAVAAFVHAGVAPLASRADLVGGVLPPRDEERAARLGGHLDVLMRFALARRGIVERTDRLQEEWQRILDPDPAATPVAELPDSVLARAAWSLEDRDWRDALMAALCPGTVPVTETHAGDAERARSAASRCPWVHRTVADGTEDTTDEQLRVRSRLVELTRLVPVEVTPPALTVVAQLAWWSGDGAVAGIALDRALEIDPDYRLAQLMSQLLAAGVRLQALTSPGSEAA